ncbi:hypothetical protein COCMIDRAFT_9902 [Bipolaris oryzae ATCC 44560]|uniref:Uncharacterized protein n=1 Tax=Bipolaris oryzae ATCC 44560 TaxID=930090 RepID=W6YLV4_COCMI|nr:uncharacterized protein COCMIDRAFT_9902 [Bipolaris oryzae ATCC 44560]EUC40172.1 hypothetical protein COCMIDRAFT_9902 [Bipolaris oryzae ATCC 44560]
MAVQTDAQVAQLCRSAFEAEHFSNFREAFDRHGDAITALNRLADDARFLDRERKRDAHKQAKFHGKRREVLQPILSGHKTRLDVVLPSSFSAQESLTKLINGLPCLSFDEMLLSRSLKPLHDKMRPTVPQGTAINSKQIVASLLASSKGNSALIPTEIQHIFPLNKDGTHSVSFYTPLLDKAQPDITFHVYVSCENVFTSGRWYYFKVKDSSERQTLYVLQGLKRPRYQVTKTSLSRATEFTTPCVETVVTPVRSTGSSHDGAIGRQLTHFTCSSLPVIDKPDRTKHVKWQPRRMAWGGRNFVWKQGKGMLEKELCEVKREWPQPGSKTGKMLDETFEPIVHAQTKVAVKKTLVVTFGYGCGIDFLFRELVLASLLTSHLVQAFGHSS